MPLRNFVCPDTDKIIPLDEAPAYFEEAGIMPAETVLAIIENETSRKDEDPRYLTPSRLNTEVLCRRELAITRFLPYDLNPQLMEEAQEGTLWHKVYKAQGAGDDWLHEVRVPFYKDSPGVGGSGGNLDKMVKGEDGLYRVEVYPGVLLRGTIDRLSLDYKVLIDHKAHKFPFAPPATNKPSPKWEVGGEYYIQQQEGHSYQLSAYAHIVEIITGEEVEQLWVWRKFRGSKNRAYTFRKMPIKKMSRETMWARIKDYIEPLLQHLRNLYEIRDDEKAITEYISNMPMDGHDQGMFNDQKCTKYCAVRPLCFGMEGDFLGF